MLRRAQHDTIRASRVSRCRAIPDGYVRGPLACFQQCENHMNRKIILHIGSPKCGSTYLQQMLLKNTAVLRAHDMLYPHDGGSHPGNAGALDKITCATLESYFKGTTNTVILSHEDLYSLAATHGTPLVPLLDDMQIDVQLVAFLRPFSEFIYGDYSQFMKQYFPKFLAARNPYDGRDFTAFVQRRIDTMKPAAFLRRWQARFPQLPLALNSNRNIRATMTDLLGPELGEALCWDVPQSQVNRSLRMTDCEEIASAMRDPATPDNSIRAMFKEAVLNVAKPDSGKTPERSAWLEEQFAPQNLTLLKEFGFDNRLAPGLSQAAD